ncbi:MAG: PDZ domain-containing protein [Gammaproteobacteria bacterium]|nr:PDZ domain-containing protein [Gammaproteobacteria bacterium]
MSPTSDAAVPHFLEQLEHWLARRWVIVTLNILLLALLAYSAAQWTWRLLAPPMATPAESLATANDITADYDLTALLSTNIFGQAAPVNNGKVSLENIPLSSLNLVLSGVLATPNGSVALISADGGPETPFAVGQDIIPGATLYAVYSDRVLIQRGARTESLMLKDIGPALADGSIVAAGPSNADNAVQRIDQRNFTVDRQSMNQQMQKPEFLSQALMVPHASGGFLVREIQPGSMYEKLGLRVGDVINTVNGQPVNTVEDVMKLYQQLGSSGGAAQVSLQIRRGGRTETLQYNLQ